MDIIKTKDRRISMEGYPRSTGESLDDYPITSNHPCSFIVEVDGYIYCYDVPNLRCSKPNEYIISPNFTFIIGVEDAQNGKPGIVIDSPEPFKLPLEEGDKIAVTMMPIVKDQLKKIGDERLTKFIIHLTNKT